MVVFVLDFVSINPECRKAFLGVGGQNGSKINSTRALGSVESPDGFDGHGIHIHGLSAITPAWGDCDGDINTFFFEIIGAGGGFRNAANG